MCAAQGRLYVGTSGYQYDHWRGVFYPDDIPKKDWFNYYTEYFDTVEINNTFYNLPSPETFKRWAEEAPDDFCYTLKYSRYGSHIKKLKDPQDTITYFLERAKYLSHKIGPILVQLPPGWKVNTERLENFLEAIDKNYRWVLEFRNSAWLCEDVFDILRRHNVALCIHDMISDHPWINTADWTYLRFHGEDYAGCYSQSYLDEVAAYVAENLNNGLDVYAYFNNDAEGYAVQNARDLKDILTGEK